MKFLICLVLASVFAVGAIVPVLGVYDGDGPPTTVDRAYADDRPIPDVPHREDTYRPAARNWKYCDEIGHAVPFVEIAQPDFDRLYYSAACLEGANRQLLVACGPPIVQVPAVPPDEGRALVPCLSLVSNFGSDQIAVNHGQFGLVEPNGHAWAAKPELGAPPVLVDRGRHTIVRTVFATRDLLDPPFLVQWWPPFDAPTAGPQALTVIVEGVDRG